MSPSKENAKIRAQRPGYRLQELEQELAKIHHRGSVFTAVSTQPLTPPISIINPVQMQPMQTLLTIAPQISTVPVATVTPNIVAPRSDTPVQTDVQDNINEVIYFFVFEKIVHIFNIYVYIYYSIHEFRLYVKEPVDNIVFSNMRYQFYVDRKQILRNLLEKYQDS